MHSPIISFKTENKTVKEKLQGQNVFPSVCILKDCASPHHFAIIIIIIILYHKKVETLRKLKVESQQNDSGEIRSSTTVTLGW